MTGCEAAALGGLLPAAAALTAAALSGAWRDASQKPPEALSSASPAKAMTCERREALRRGSVALKGPLEAA